MNGEATFRDATPEDIPLLMRFIRELADYEDLSGAVSGTEGLLREWMFEKKAAKAIFAVVDGVEAGYALFFYNFSTFLCRAGLYVEDIYVSPPYRGRGYGKALMGYIAKMAVAEGCGRMEWSCLDWNESAIAFYLSCGAVAMEEWTVYRLEGESLAAFAGK